MDVGQGTGGFVFRRSLATRADAIMPPRNSNRVRHIRHTRRLVAGAASAGARATELRGAAARFISGGRLCASSGRRPGLRPGAERRGKPRRAARVMIAGTERPRVEAISCGVLFCIHMSRNTPSCSCQLGPAAGVTTVSGAAGMGSVVMKSGMPSRGLISPDIAMQLIRPGTGSRRKSAQRLLGSVKLIHEKD